MAGKQQGGLSRRSFVTALGAGLAAPYIIPAAALGKGKDTPPSERINIGVVGTGSQANGLTENAIRHKNTHVMALCDVDSKRLAEAKGKVDGYYENTDCATHSDYRELLARDDIDAVIVATPDHWHALVCVEAARRGKDIYCEKPLTWSLGEGKAVVKAVQDNKRVFQTGSMQRSGRQFKKASELVRNGYIGDIKRILVALPDFGNAIWADRFPKPPKELDYEFYVGPAEWAPFHPKRYHWDWRWWMGFGGGQMMDWIGHHGDIGHMAMGWDNTGPNQVEGIRWEPGKKRNNLYDAPARYMFNCTYAGGTTMTVANNSDMPSDWASPGQLGTMFFGSKGRWIWVDRGGIKASDDKILKNRVSTKEFRFRRQGNHMTDWIQCIESREEPIAPVNAGHRSASIGHLGKIACTLGGSFKWDPAKEEVIDNPILNGMLTRKYRGDWTLD